MPSQNRLLGWMGLVFLLGALGIAVSCEKQRPTEGARSSPAEARIARPELPSVLIERVPHVRQKPDFCGEAAVASWLGALGHPTSQDAVFDVSGMNPSRGMGVTTRELETALRNLGFRVGPVWNEVRASAASSDMARLFSDLHSDLEKHVPSIVCMHYDERPNTTEHFRLILGYDAERDEVVYHEPAEDDGAYRRMSRDRFLALWPLVYKPDVWTVIRLRLEPGTLRIPGVEEGQDAAAYAQHVMKLRERLGRGMSVVVEVPFVVVGDGGQAAVAKRAEGTVRWTVQKLQQDFFDRAPRRILDIWLFETSDSYTRGARALTGEDPTTPYGFYSREHDAMIMNIATGGGTLVHEIVHPYIEANFPGCPAWFNEGLGSLFEQSAERDGHIVGLTNWRLAGLQRALRRGRGKTLRAVVSTSTDAFYGDDSGLHYATARYLLYYLQERGVLRQYYRDFVKNRANDPSGWATLMQELGNPDESAFQKQWERFVLALQFP
jgi:hypothetical protein